MNILAELTTFEIAAYTTGIVTILTAFGAVIVTTVVGIKRGLNEIKEKVNGAHTTQQAENKALKDKVDVLVALVAEKRQNVALLEQAAATQAASQQLPTASDHPPAEVIIKQPPHEPIPTTVIKKP